ncbi:arginase family protein [Microbacterium invictum]|uniref:Arginase family protein n=1 Tax=Microbacterium invictum TaxID=515415 RepID=A0ABZ0VDD2_9MICO|nr:arginase family protein [Microbacterium invictum]WQB71636.1 arginase family protein [Microbacterium invictum]
MSGLFHDPLWPRAGDWPSAHDGAETSGPIDVALLGVPTYRTSLSATGAHATPAAVREALRRYSPTVIGPPAVDLDAALTIVDAGDVPEPDGEEGEARVRRLVADLAARGGLVIALGGDNAATVPVAQGARAGGLITLDAHLDLRDGRSNGSPVRRLVEDGLDPARIVQIGIADFANSPAYIARARALGITLVTLDEARGRPAGDLMDEAFAIAGAGTGGVHLDIDVDVCDRSVAPACPASVPGGLSAHALRALVRAAASDARLVTADIVEIDATADTDDGRTVRLAALCVLELLAGRAIR